MLEVKLSITQFFGVTLFLNDCSKAKCIALTAPCVSGPKTGQVHRNLDTETQQTYPAIFNHQKVVVVFRAGQKF